MTILRTIKGKLVAGTAAGIACLLSLFGVAIYLIGVKTAQDSFDRSLMRRAEEITRGPVPRGRRMMGGAGLGGPSFGGGGMRQPGRQIPPNMADEPPRPPDAPPDGPPLGPFEGAGEAADRVRAIRTPRVIAPNGKVILPPGMSDPWSAPEFEKGLRGASTLATVPYEGRLIRVATRPFRGPDGVSAVLQIAQEQEPVDLTARSLGQALLSMVPLGVALAAFASWLLVRSVLAPVDRVTEEALRLAGHDDLSGRLKVVGDDEVSRLGGALNCLLSRIQSLYAKEQQARQASEKALEAQKRFVSDASHELRTPLTRISLAAQNALAAQEEEVRSRALESIHRSSGQMSRLVSHLLALARMDAGQAGLVRQPFDLAALAAQAAEETGDPRVTHRGEGRAVGDPDGVRRILDNLVENARRHTPESGSIEVLVKEELGRVFAIVSDTGEGIPAEALSRIGTRFFRVDESRNRSSGGTGLGLALSMELAQAMGGSLTLVSEQGAGVRATLSLPKA